MTQILFFILCAVASVSQAGLKSNKIVELARAYQESTPRLDRNLCAIPDASPCVDYVCKTLGDFECDSNTKVIEVTQACRGNYGFDCVKTACGFADYYECASRESLLNIVTACRGNVDGKCVQSVCTHAGQFGCNSSQELVAAAQACTGP